MTPTSGFDLLPAIDLRGGRVVRLRQGDFQRETTYGDDPIAVARRLVGSGASWLHVVDLDGARSGVPVHDVKIGSLVKSLDGAAAVEVAGGRRTLGAVSAAFDAGSARVVLGTAALRDARFAGRAVAAFGASRIVVALDVRGGLALTDGWATDADATPATTALEMIAEQGVETFEVTAVERDGTLSGPDLELLSRLVGVDRGQIIASGGIATIDDLRRIRDIGCAGAIVGRALYEGRFELADALTIVGGGVVREGDRTTGRPPLMTPYATSRRRPVSTSWTRPWTGTFFVQGCARILDTCAPVRHSRTCTSLPGRAREDGGI